MLSHKNKRYNLKKKKVKILQAKKNVAKIQWQLFFMELMDGC